jgi:hypothetical protein
MDQWGKAMQDLQRARQQQDPVLWEKAREVEQTTFPQAEEILRRHEPRKGTFCYELCSISEACSGQDAIAAEEIELAKRFGFTATFKKREDYGGYITVLVGDKFDGEILQQKMRDTQNAEEA